MRLDEPSRTARGVAVMRSLLERPPWPTGDAAADERLTHEITGGPLTEADARNVRGSGRLFAWVEARTAFFDRVLIAALADGIDQVVMLGAGYDGRAVRYRTPGVTFFEVDHPATQSDKLARYASAGASTEGITFVGADFTEPGLGDALARAGHDASRRTLDLCEGVLRYLPEASLRELLRVAADRAATGSRLATTISTREGEPTADDLAHEAALADAGEAVLTVVPRATALEWVAAAGWTVEAVDDPLQPWAGPSGYGGLLVEAVRGPTRPLAGPIP
jgi:methyltransferase (TIGR00027 family)